MHEKSQKARNSRPHLDRCEGAVQIYQSRHPSSRTAVYMDPLRSVRTRCHGRRNFHLLLGRRPFGRYMLHRVSYFSTAMYSIFGCAQAARDGGTGLALASSLIIMEGQAQ